MNIRNFIFVSCFISLAVFAAASPERSKLQVTKGLHHVPPSRNEIITDGIIGYINTNLIDAKIESLRPGMIESMTKDFNNIKHLLVQPVPAIFRGAMENLMTLKDSTEEEITPKHKNIIEKVAGHIKQIGDAFVNLLKSKIDPQTHKGIQTMANAIIQGMKNYFYIKQRRPELLENGDIKDVRTDAVVLVDDDGDGYTDEVWFDTDDGSKPKHIDVAEARELAQKHLRSHQLSDVKPDLVEDTESPSRSSSLSSSSTSNTKPVQSHELTDFNEEDEVFEDAVDNDDSNSFSSALSTQSRHRKRGLWSALTSWSVVQNWYEVRINKLVRSIIRETNNAVHNQFLEQVRDITTAVHSSLSTVLRRYIPEEYLHPPSELAPDGPTIRRTLVKRNPIKAAFVQFEENVRKNVMGWMKKQMNALEDQYKDIAASMVQDSVRKMFLPESMQQTN
ncbi:hypothetical protein BKA69DRAFT_626334 [Paraphysoderma sedebokerense]|nr:hypothetical protein BKA69DRAFT_626334 [Paraphysoderma sedebokerense]